ncbi:hypothetical protein MAPG_09137 [Magnaporthiopsis poae ATCC 64411]|uniref:Uncharacterized protein n=1 Tax=Magnaporthiopsis poae (strain ATCC 64411 / 73-15) TaxID=644358 RepID=A0A0C4E958_MAGP6|nr:hypothetical protein MAPG_09137 [Magnaporthiopsis poae ATCC 64411]
MPTGKISFITCNVSSTVMNGIHRRWNWFDRLCRILQGSNITFLQVPGNQLPWFMTFGPRIASGLHAMETSFLGRWPPAALRTRDRDEWRRSPADGETPG